MKAVNTTGTDFEIFQHVCPTRPVNQQTGDPFTSGLQATNNTDVRYPNADIDFQINLPVAGRKFGVLQEPTPHNTASNVVTDGLTWARVTILDKCHCKVRINPLDPGGPLISSVHGPASLVLGRNDPELSLINLGVGDLPTLFGQGPATTSGNYETFGTEIGPVRIKACADIESGEKCILLPMTDPNYGIEYGTDNSSPDAFPIGFQETDWYMYCLFGPLPADDTLTPPDVLIASPLCQCVGDEALVFTQLPRGHFYGTERGQEWFAECKQEPNSTELPEDFVRYHCDPECPCTFSAMPFKGSINCPPCPATAVGLRDEPGTIIQEGEVGEFTDDNGDPIFGVAYCDTHICPGERVLLIHSSKITETLDNPDGCTPYAVPCGRKVLTGLSTTCIIPQESGEILVDLPDSPGTVVAINTCYRTIDETEEVFVIPSLNEDNECIWKAFPCFDIQTGTADECIRPEEVSDITVDRSGSRLGRNKGCTATCPGDKIIAWPARDTTNAGTSQDPEEVCYFEFIPCYQVRKDTATARIPPSSIGMVGDKEVNNCSPCVIKAGQSVLLFPTADCILNAVPIPKVYDVSSLDGEEFVSTVTLDECNLIINREEFAIDEDECELTTNFAGQDVLPLPAPNLSGLNGCTMVTEVQLINDAQSPTDTPECSLEISVKVLQVTGTGCQQVISSSQGSYPVQLPTIDWSGLTDKTFYQPCVQSDGSIAWKCCNIDISYEGCNTVVGMTTPVDCDPPTCDEDPPCSTPLCYICFHIITNPADTALFLTPDTWAEQGLPLGTQVGYLVIDRDIGGTIEREYYWIYALCETPAMDAQQQLTDNYDAWTGTFNPAYDPEIETEGCNTAPAVIADMQACFDAQVPAPDVTVIIQNNPTSPPDCCP